MHRSTWQGRVYWVQTSFSTQTNSYMDHNTTEVCKYKQKMNGHVKDQISIDLTVLKNIYFKIFDRLILNIQYKKFQSRWYQIDTCLPFSLNLRHGFRSESEQPYRNRVVLSDTYYYTEIWRLAVRVHRNKLPFFGKKVIESERITFKFLSLFDSSWYKATGLESLGFTN